MGIVTSRMLATMLCVTGARARHSMASEYDAVGLTPSSHM